MTLADSDRTRLVDAARSAALRAYAPASRFRVGAAIMGDDGSIHAGCNVENASYGLTICAERHAIGAAVLAGNTRFVAVAVSTDLHEPARPCGACRQALAEFGPTMTVVLAGRERVEVTTLDVLLPDPFTFDSMHEAPNR